MILIIDNYDSFTYNLFQQISMLGKSVKVVRNDAITIEEIQKLSPEAIILSPGPGTPNEAGITIEVIKELYQKFPILGICLGRKYCAGKKYYAWKAVPITIRANRFICPIRWGYRGYAISFTYY